jgi:predicted porin
MHVAPLQPAGLSNKEEIFMQKKLIAVAVAGALAAPLALAQTNVTIEGQMKLHLDTVSSGGATVVGNTSSTSRARITDNNSWLRFSGKEDLGGGTYANFQIESAVGTSDNVGTTGAASNAAPGVTSIGARDTWVGLGGNSWGTVRMGKISLYYSSAVPVDTAGLADGLPLPNSHLSILHQNGAGATATGLAAANGFGGRLNNTIQYITPSYNGFSANIAYSTQSESTLANLQGKDSAWVFTPSYVNGPWAVTYSHISMNAVGATAVPAAAASGTNSKADRFGAAYAFPMGLKVGLIWDRNRIEVADGTNSLVALGVAAAGGNVGAHANRARTAWALPVSYVTGAHKFNFTWAKANDLGTNVGGVQESGAKFMMMGYTYAMSKRTNLNVSYASINNGKNAAYDFWHPSSNVSGTSAVGLPIGSDPRMFAVGMQHSF